MTLHDEGPYWQALNEERYPVPKDSNIRRVYIANGLGYYTVIDDPVFGEIPLLSKRDYLDEYLEQTTQPFSD